MCPFDYLLLFRSRKGGVRHFQISWLANMWTPSYWLFPVKWQWIFFLESYTLMIDTKICRMLTLILLKRRYWSLPRYHVRGPKRHWSFLLPCLDFFQEAMRFFRGLSRNRSPPFFNGIDFCVHLSKSVGSWCD